MPLCLTCSDEVLEVRPTTLNEPQGLEVERLSNAVLPSHGVPTTPGRWSSLAE